MAKMEDEEVIVFGLCRSPFTFRVVLALKLKGVKYRYIEEDPSNKSPLFLKYNSLQKQFPLLVHNGFPIAESQIILEYIDQTWNQGFSILPQDPYERAVARFWSKFVDEKCVPVVLYLFKQEGGEDLAKEMFEILEKEIHGKKFFGGEKIGMVDIVAIGFTYWIKLVQEALGLDLLTEENYPKLSVWNDEFLNIGLVKESFPSRDYLIDIIRSRLPTARDDYK